MDGPRPVLPSQCSTLSGTSRTLTAPCPSCPLQPRADPSQTPHRPLTDPSLTPHSPLTAPCRPAQRVARDGELPQRRGRPQARRASHHLRLATQPAQGILPPAARATIHRSRGLPTCSGPPSGAKRREERGERRDLAPPCQREAAAAPQHLPTVAGSSTPGAGATPTQRASSTTPTPMWLASVARTTCTRTSTSRTTHRCCRAPPPLMSGMTGARSTFQPLTALYNPLQSLSTPFQPFQPFHPLQQ